MKQTTKSTSGTHFLDVTVFASRKELITICGKPQPSSDDFKVRYCWDMETEDGDVFTIYDWRDLFIRDLDEPITWHIGSFDYLAADTARHELTQALKQLRYANQIPS
jgi:hypothetical protein